MSVLRLRHQCHTALLCLSCSFAATLAAAQDVPAEETLLEEVVISAGQQTRQALGASTISADDIAKTAVSSDISEIVRKMPGVNLTGNSVSGQRGNQRQIDIRGMGPENTLILIDGKPVTSRNALRMNRQGERDTRGDSSWVPPEMIESIDVLRGPAAARYGNGAAGGVVNIITKRPTEMTGQVGVHFESPESSLEGGSKRTNFMLAGPAGDALSFRVFGNTTKTDADEPQLNGEGTQSDCAIDADGRCVYEAPAGVEGVKHLNFGGLLTYKANENNEIDLELGWSRQTNAFAGDMQTGSATLGQTAAGQSLIGAETNRILRQTAALTHRGNYSFGDSVSYLQFERTTTNRLREGTAGGSDGNIVVADLNDRLYSTYSALSAKTEWNLPMAIAGHDSMLTLGGEFRSEKMDDNGREFKSGDYSSQQIFGLYSEANIYWNNQLTLTPGLRYDYSDRFGGNASPSLNASYKLNDQWEVKLGVARAFKAPNIFQLNPDYLAGSRGNGCPSRVTCDVRGNQDLKAETAINKEIGLAYTGETGVSGSLTWFRNDYKNRIASDMYSYVPGVTDTGGAKRIYQWGNTPKAVIEGIEGNFSTDLTESLAFNANFTKMITSIDKTTGNPLSLVPEHTINATLTWAAREDLNFTFGMTHYGRIEPAKQTLHTLVAADQTPRGSYSLFNAGMTWDVAEGARLSAGVTNLFDKQILRSGEGANTFNEPGRAFYVGLTKSF